MRRRPLGVVSLLRKLRHATLSMSWKHMLLRCLELRGRPTCKLQDASRWFVKIFEARGETKRSKNRRKMVNDFVRSEEHRDSYF